MQRTPAPTAPDQPTPLYPDLTDHQLSQPVPLNLTINNVQQVAVEGIRPILLPQPIPPSHGHTKGFPIVHKTSTPPLQSTPHYPAVMPGPTAHHYQQVPPPPFPATQKAPANPPVNLPPVHHYAPQTRDSFPAVQRAPANPPAMHLHEAPQTRAPSFPAVQRVPAQQPKAPPSGTVLHEAPKDRHFY